MESKYYWDRKDHDNALNALSEMIAQTMGTHLRGTETVLVIYTRLVHTSRQSPIMIKLFLWIQNSRKPFALAGKPKLVLETGKTLSPIMTGLYYWSLSTPMLIVSGQKRLNT